MEDSVIIKGFGSNGSESRGIIVYTNQETICPFCHLSIETQPLTYVDFGSHNVQILLKCKSCKNTFIGKTQHRGKDGNYNKYNITVLSKGIHKKRFFEKEIQDLSPAFIQIFEESEFAEQENLMEICGVGYRKALEFLIKDYLISIKPDDEELIKKKFLSNCINEDITDTNIKQIAKKASWLGNDETHYVRKWEEKDLSDLKKLINITMHYILMDIQSKRYLEEMEIK